MSSTIDISKLINIGNLSRREIIRYLPTLDATCWYWLGRTSVLLEYLVETHPLLWRHIDARKSPNDKYKIPYCLLRANDKTETFLTRGDCALDVIIPKDFFSRINALTSLTVLALEKQTIDGEIVTMTSFPKGLQELSLKQARVTNAIDFFHLSSDHLKDLRVLILDHCDWVKNSDLLPISEYENLEILSIYKCGNIDNSVPVLGLSGEDKGFKQIKIIDARLTRLGNTLLRFLYDSKTLLAIYLENEDTRQGLNFYFSKLHINKETPVGENCKLPPEGQLRSKSKHPTYLDDSGLMDYLSTSSAEHKLNLFSSFLYEDPHKNCTCGFNGPHAVEETSSSLDNADREAKDEFIRIVEDKGANQACIVEESKENKRMHQLNYRAPCEPSSSAAPVDDGNMDKDLEEEHLQKMIRTFKDFVYHQCEWLNEGFDNEQNINEDLQYIGLSLINNPMGWQNARRRRIQRKIAEAQAQGKNWEGELDIDDDLNKKQEKMKMIIREVQLFNVAKEYSIPLRTLCLRGYKKITDVALYYIKDLDLDLLDLTDTSVTVEGINIYLKKHPLCRVVHQKFCTCPTNLR